MHASALKLREALGYCKPQPAPFRIARAVSTDKPLRKFIGIHGQFRLRNIFQFNSYTVRLLLQKNIYPGTRHRVFDNIRIQVIKDSVRLLAVQRQKDAGGGKLKFKVQPSCCDAVFLLQIGLAEQIADVHIHDLKRHRLAAGLADFKQIFNEYFQAIRFFLQNGQVFLLLFFRNARFLQQINIGNDCGQRCLQVMGNIGNQFRFHALALDLLFHRALEVRLNLPQF